MALTMEQLQAQIEDLRSETSERRTGIWLEVVEAQYGKGTSPLKVQLKGDRAHPKPVWWPVADDALGFDKDSLDAYKRILDEIDKKRVVLARLTWDSGGSKNSDQNSNQAEPKEPTRLHCDALRFQSAELGSR